MMGAPAGRAMLEQMLGPAERAYLRSIRNALWLAGGIAALAAVAVSLVLARQIAAPVRTLTAAARRLAAGDRSQRIPVRSTDELGELAAAFNALTAALAHQETLRRQMVADIAHELRTPLAIIQANLLVDGVRPLSTAAVADIHQDTQLLARLVGDLRDLSLAEAGQLPLRREATDLGALARASVERFAPQAEANGVRLAAEAVNDLPIADVDPDRIAQVLSNLLDNALRHTPAGGVVSVRVERGMEPGVVQVTVRDTGRGIAPEHLSNIFERFYRADSARSRRSGGSGIGLAVVKQLVAAHGGRIWVESAAGEGTSFRFVLPRVAAPDDAHANARRQEPPRSHDRRPNAERVS